MLKKILPASIYKFFHTWYRRGRLAAAYNVWKAGGSHIPPPHNVKQYHIFKSADRYPVKVFIESGTYKGNMLNAVKEAFRELHSIELDKTLFEKAGERFIKEKNIFLYHGDSATMLPEILEKINEPALFWLDGHYSGGITAKGDLITPIVKELSILSKRNFKDIILIDDARLFNGTDDYPDINEMLRIVREDFPDGELRIGDDIITIVRK